MSSYSDQEGLRIDLSSPIPTGGVTPPPIPVKARLENDEDDEPEYNSYSRSGPAVPFRPRPVTNTPPVPQSQPDPLEREKKERVKRRRRSSPDPTPAAVQTPIRPNQNDSNTIQPGQEDLADVEALGIEVEAQPGLREKLQSVDYGLVFYSFAGGALTSSVTFFALSKIYPIYLPFLVGLFSVYLLGIATEQLLTRNHKRFSLTLVAVMGAILGIVLALF
jgi:hypothetical protein